MSFAFGEDTRDTGRKTRYLVQQHLDPYLVRFICGGESY